ncbi:hypothetical protein LIER_03266 [Lithospermum erythrorhizon]|uniref:Uncharacterized protein n=1 Tax=Lithospermum erythrorhizon TaxID=34254 RepID=A0AAV3NXB1_LITER
MARKTDKQTTLLTSSSKDKVGAKPYFRRHENSSSYGINQIHLYTISIQLSGRINFKQETIVRWHECKHDRGRWCWFDLPNNNETDPGVLGSKVRDQEERLVVPQTELAR